MQNDNQTVTLPPRAEARLIYADEINRKAIELGRLSNDLANTAVAVVLATIDLGELLTLKKADLDKTNPGTWVEWCNENLVFSKDSEERYRKLSLHSARVRNGIESGVVTSIRTACAMIASDFDEMSSDKGGIPTASTPPADERPDPALRKLQSAIGRWTGWLFRNPVEKWTPEVREEFLIDLAGRERTRRKNGWDLPVIDVDSENPC